MLLNTYCGLCLVNTSLASLQKLELNRSYTEKKTFLDSLNKLEMHNELRSTQCHVYNAPGGWSRISCQQCKQAGHVKASSDLSRKGICTRSRQIVDDMSAELDRLVEGFSNWSDKNKARNATKMN